MATRKNRADLTTQSDEIKNEATALANTKTRVAAMVEDTNESNVNWLDDVVVTTSGNLDTKVPTAKAVNDAIASALVGLWDDRGNFDASVNAYPSSGGSGTAGAILKGDIYTISVPGILPTGKVVKVRDTVRALVDTPGNTEANWAINSIDKVEKNSTASSAPTTAFDSSKGYGVYYTVQDTSTGLIYICRDASVGAAVWELDTSQIVPFSLLATNLQIQAGVDILIPQCPQLPVGYVWSSNWCAVEVTNSGTPYDSTPDLNIKTVGASRQQFYDAQAIIASNSDTFLHLSKRDIVAAGGAINSTLVEWDGVTPDMGALALSFGSVVSTTGSARVHIYGTASIIKL